MWDSMCLEWFRPEADLLVERTGPLLEELVLTVTFKQIFLMFSMFILP